ncbi:MAG: SLC13 family permease [Janthinobacterium lividum]
MSYTKALNYYLDADPYKHKIQPNERAGIIASLKLLTLGMDETLYSHKTSAQAYYFVTQGSLSLERADGQTTIVSAGQYLGEEAALGLDSYISKAVARENTQIIQFSAQDFQTLLHQNSELQRQVIASFTHKINPDRSGLNPEKSSSNNSKTVSTSDSSSTLGWILSLVIPLFVYVILSKTLIDQNARLFLTILSSAFCLWSFALVPPYISTLLVIASSLALELAPKEIVLSSFATDYFLMLFSVFALGSALAQSGILYRMMLLILKFMPPTHFWTNTSVFILGAVCTPLIPSAHTRQTMFQKFTKSLIYQLSLSPSSVTATKIALTAYTGVTLLSPVFLTSSLYNFFILNLLNINQEQFRWVEWFLSAVPTTIFLLLGLTLALSLFFKEDEKPVPFRERVETQLQLLGHVQNKDRGLIFLTLAYLFGLISINYHGISAVCISLIMMICLIMFNFISSERLRDHLNWPSLFLFAFLGGIVALFNALELPAKILPFLDIFGQYIHRDFTIFAMLLGLILMIFRIFLPYGLVVVMAATLLIPFAQQQGFNGWLVGFLILLFSKESLIPTTSSSLQYFMASFVQDLEKQRTLLWKYHIMINLIKFPAVYFSISFWKGMSLV